MIIRHFLYIFWTNSATLVLRTSSRPLRSHRSFCSYKSQCAEAFANLTYPLGLLLLFLLERLFDCAILLSLLLHLSDGQHLCLRFGALCGSFLGLSCSFSVGPMQLRFLYHLNISSSIRQALIHEHSVVACVSVYSSSLGRCLDRFLRHL